MDRVELRGGDVPRRISVAVAFGGDRSEQSSLQIPNHSERRLLSFHPLLLVVRHQIFRVRHSSFTTLLVAVLFNLIVVRRLPLGWFLHCRSFDLGGNG